MSAAAPNPYVGLRPFQTADAPWFFGRGREGVALARKIRSNRFTTVVGASGSGKSSLVLAGVLPQLVANGWQSLDTKPGTAPIAQLAAALATAVGREDLLAHARRFRFDASLRGSAFGLANVVASMAPNTPPIVLVVDQFEELFRYGEGMSGSQRAAMREEGRAFVELLLTAARREGSRLHVVLTMRSDYFGNCAAYQGLAEAVSASLYLVSIPNRDQLEAAIRLPVEKAGATIDNRLVQRLLVEVEQEADRLPLLQHCLMRLWRQASVGWSESASEPAEARVHSPSATCARRCLDLSAYSGLRESLSAHADEIMSELERQNSAYPRLAEFLFRALTEIDNQRRPIRRPRTMAELAMETGADPSVLQQVIAPFRRHGVTFLTPYGDQPLDDNDVVDISHEALIRSWKRINDPITNEQTGWPSGWLQREEKDGRTWRSLLLYVEMRMSSLPPSYVEMFSRWLRTLPGSGWAERHGGNWEAVERLFPSTSPAKTQDIKDDHTSLFSSTGPIDAEKLVRQYAEKHLIVRRNRQLLQLLGRDIPLFESSHEDADADWLQGVITFAVEVFSGNIDVVHLDTRGYNLLEQVWLNDIIARYAYGACREAMEEQQSSKCKVFQMLVEEHRTSSTRFSRLKDYLTDIYFSKDSKGFRDNMQHIIMMKARYYSTISGERQEAKAWYCAERFVDLFYCNILRAVENGDNDDAVKSLSDLMKYSYNDYCLLNAFEAIALKFVRNLRWR